MKTLEHPPNGSPSPCDGANPGARGKNQTLAVIDKRTAANRRNALKSTGPRTKAGKLAVARNSLGHGINAVSPVIETVESPLEWKRYRKGMLASLAPLAMLETTFAERIILAAWRLRRVARYETEQLRSKQEGAKGVIANEIHHEAASSGEATVRDFEFNLSDLVAKSTDEPDQDGCDELDVPDDTELDEADAQELLSSAHDALGWSDRFEGYWRRLAKPGAWTAGLLRQLVGELAEQDCKSREKHMADELTQRLDEYRREHLLPDEETLERVMRYETHLSRQLHRELHELQRLQAMRQGQRVPAPVALDIDVAVGSETGPMNGG